MNLFIVKGIQKREATIITNLASEHVRTGRFKEPPTRGTASTDVVYFVESDGVELQIGPLVDSEDPRELWWEVRYGGRETPRLANCSGSDEIAHVRKIFQNEQEKFRRKIRPISFHFNCLLHMEVKRLRERGIFWFCQSFVL